MLVGGVADAGATIYTGTGIANDVGQTAMNVGGASTSHVGDLVCDSGAFSGETCNIRVAATGQTDTMDDGHGGTVMVTNMVTAEQQDRADASGSGDSGGPYFSLSSDGGHAIARGVVSAHDRSTEVPCSGVATGGGRVCGWRSFYPDIMIALRDFPATINVS
jgi:hypothetical protein